MSIFDAMKGTGSVLWDTSTYCGRPLFANPQAQVFYPPTDVAVFIATFLGSSRLAYALEWELVLHVFAAGAFTYLMLRRIGVCRAAALCSGLIFELGGFFASQTQHLGAIEGAAWIPLMWTAAWEFRTAFSRCWFGIGAVACAMTILAGFPAMAATAIISTIILTGLLCLLRQMSLYRVGFVVAAIALGVGLTAVMLIPAAQLTLLSVGKYRTDWFDGWGFPPTYLITLVKPPNHQTVCDIIYCGISGLILALYAAIRIRSKIFLKVAFPFLATTGLSGIWMLGTATVCGQAMWAVVPNFVKGCLYPHYGMATFCLGLAALAGIGLDQIKGLSSPAKYMIALIVAADLICVNSGRPMSALDLRQEPGITREQINGSPATSARLRELIGGGSLGRFDTHEASPIWSTTAPLTQLPTASGYDPLVLERLTQVRLSFAKGFRWGAWYQVENVASPVIDLLNVHYILSGKPIGLSGNGTPKLSFRAEFQELFVYEDSAALPRFFLVPQIRLVHGSQEAFTALHQSDFAPARFAIVETTNSPESSHNLLSLKVDGGPIEAEENVTIQRYAARDILLGVQTNKTRFLVTSEAQYPGWHAMIDGAEAPIVMTNGAFRGLLVPSGSHIVQFRFVPVIVDLGAITSALSAGVILLIVRLKWN
jgi:hypothetical protein